MRLLKFLGNWSLSYGGYVVVFILVTVLSIAGLYAISSLLQEAIISNKALMTWLHSPISSITIWQLLVALVVLRILFK